MISRNKSWEVEVNWLGCWNISYGIQSVYDTKHSHHRSLRRQNNSPYNIPTPERKAADEKLKEEWLSNFSQLIRESNNNNGDTD